MSLTHLAVIMDGNRRWARQQGASVLYDKSSAQAVNDTISVCLERGIAYLSLYALSIENLQRRDHAELERLYGMLQELCVKRRDECVQKGVRVRFIGDRELFPAHLRQSITDIERATADGTKLCVSILFCYGAQQEIAAACAAIARKVAAGELSASAITDATVQQHLWTVPAPAPDLIIRTSGAQRLSNFLLFQAAYAEIQFVSYYWPDMNKARLTTCLEAFDRTARGGGA